MPSAPAKVQFSLLHLLSLVTGICAWLGMIHYFGTMGVIVSSPLLGCWFIIVGTFFRLRILSMLGAILFFAGPLVLGIVAACLDR